MKQPPLFPAEEAPLPRGLVKVVGSTRELTKAQREFNRLTENIGALRSEQERWRLAAAACQREAAARLQPLERELMALQRDTVLWIDGYLRQPPAGERLGRKLREKLVGMLRILAGAVLDAGPDAEVEAAYDWHSDTRYRDERREEAEAMADLLKEAAGEGHAFADDAESAEAMIDEAAQRLHERRAEPPSADETAKPDSRRRRRERALAREAQALKDASQSLREVYRKLASLLHPDRTTDADERERRTALMAQVNEVYERRDLLGLLTIQLDTEQIDAGYLAGLADERLERFNRLLREQQRALQQELDTLRLPVTHHFRLSPRSKNLQPTLLQRVLDEELDGLRATIRYVKQDSRLLRNPATRMQFLRELQIEPELDDALGEVAEMLLEQALRQQPPARRRKRRR